MELKQIRSHSTTDLHEEIASREREIVNLRFRRDAEKQSVPGQIRVLRCDLARIKTVLRERELDVRGQAADAAAGSPRKAAKKDKAGGKP